MAWKSSAGRTCDEFVAFERVTLRAEGRLVFPRTSWVIRENEQWAIIGPNGSGKSLIALALAGQALPVRGEVRFPFAEELPNTDGHTSELAVALVSPQTHRAVVAQESSFYQSRWHSGLNEGRLTVSRFLSQDYVEEINPFEVNPRRSPRRAFLRRRSEGIRLLGIGDLLRRKVLHLSNGEMRKLLLTRALLQSPRLLVLDEPFAGLDAATRIRLREVIKKLMRDGLKVVVVTSRPDEVPPQVTHLLLVNRHRAVAQGTKGTMLRHPVIRRLRAAACSHSGLPRDVNRACLRRPPPDVSTLVELRDVTIRFGGRPILHHVTWSVRRGEHWALLGPNGAGKTTLLSLIQGDNPQAYAQDIRLFGQSPDSTQALWQARQYMGWVSTELHLHYPPEWDCLDIACSGFFDSIGLYQHCSVRRRQQARQWLQRLGLARHSRTPLGEISLGEQRLVLLARAMVKRPRLLVLDEPCQGLDRAHRQSVLAATDQVARETGASLIFVTHHRDEMPECITHVLHLEAGRAVEQGPRKAERGAV